MNYGREDGIAERQDMHALIPDPLATTPQGSVSRIDAAGCEIAWHRYGEAATTATPLVLLHGGHGSHLHWARNVEALSAERAVWVPDMPGFGQSADLGTDPHDPQRLERLLDALEASLDVLCTPVALAGFSFGGLVAACLAARLSATPGRLDRLMLMGPGGHGGQRRQRVPLVDWRLDDPQARLQALEYNLRVFMLHDAGPADGVDTTALAIHAWSCEHTRFRSRALSRSPSLAPALDAVTAPVLLAWGEHDVTAEPDIIGPALVQERDGRRLEIIPGAGHWVQYERAGIVNALLTNFLAVG